MNHFDPDRHHRRSLRLQGYDYSAPGMYFVTLCLHRRQTLLGAVSDGSVLPSEAGRMVLREWACLASRFAQVGLDAFVLMPNHVHGIIALGDRLRCPTGEAPNPDRAAPAAYVGPQCTDAFECASLSARPTGTRSGSISRILQAFKSVTTHEYALGARTLAWPPFEAQLWQRGYYEHIIRDEQELHAVRAYITANPANWNTDPDRPGMRPDGTHAVRKL